VDSSADREFFAGKNCIARKITGFEIFTRKFSGIKNFNAKKSPARFLKSRPAKQENP